MKIRPNGARVCILPPKDYRQWEALCADFTRHVVARYGLAEVKQWTFRCWNEPDLPNFWRKADVAEYLKLYDHFAQGLKSVAPAVAVGGPALSSTKTYKEPGNFLRFLHHVANGVNHATGRPGSPIDFLAVHTYGGQSGGPGPGRKFPDVDYLMEPQLRYADMRDRYAQLKHLPIHVEEWGESSSGTTGLSQQPMAAIRNNEHAAALAAARAGARTLLIEAHGCRGGIWTAGRLRYILDAGNKDGVMRSLLEALETRGARRGGVVGRVHVRAREHEVVAGRFVPRRRHRGAAAHARCRCRARRQQPARAGDHRKQERTRSRGGADVCGCDRRRRSRGTGRLRIRFWRTRHGTHPTDDVDVSAGRCSRGGDQAVLASTKREPHLA